GPGNAYVTEAKRQLVGQVGIDGLEGPSELVVVTDARADIRTLAADLVTQAEHDPEALAILVTTDPDQPAAARAAVEEELLRADRARPGGGAHRPRARRRDPHGRGYRGAAMSRAEPRPGLREIEPYDTPQLDVPVRLNTNECPHPLPEGFHDDTAEAVRALAL